MINYVEDTARYAGLLLAPAEGFGLRSRLFLPFGLFMLFWPIFGDFGCPVVTMVTFSSNLIIIQKSPIIPRGFSTNVTQDKLGF